MLLSTFLTWGETRLGLKTRKLNQGHPAKRYSTSKFSEDLRACVCAKMEDRKTDLNTLVCFKCEWVDTHVKASKSLWCYNWTTCYVLRVVSSQCGEYSGMHLKIPCVWEEKEWGWETIYRIIRRTRATCKRQQPCRKACKQGVTPGPGAKVFHLILSDIPFYFWWFKLVLVYTEWVTLISIKCSCFCFEVLSPSTCSVYVGTEGCQPIQSGTVHSLR